MMHKSVRLLSLLAALLAPFATLAQEAFPLTGRVVDSLLRPVPTAVVATLAPDSEAMLQHAVTDDEGRFTLSASGRVRLFVSCLGFAPYIGEPFDAVRATDVGELRLEGTAVGIDDVVVVAENPNATLRVEQGRMVYTPRNSASLAGGTALDALKQTPGVMVSGENEISLGGSSGVLVMLNGKQTYMQREELAAMLRSMPASSVSSVEVMSNPSAQYDAEGSAGVININVERGRSADGLSLSFNNGFSVWDNWRQNTELAFSCNTGRVSLYANYSHALGRTGLYYGMHRIQNGTDYLSPTDDEDRRRTVTGNVGVEYRPSEHHTLGARVDVNTLFGPGRTRTTTTVRDAATLDVESLLRASNDYYRQKGNRYGGTLFYTYAPREGEHYALDVDYAFFDGGAGCLQPNRYEDPAGVVLSDDLYRSVNSRAIDILALSYAQQHRLWGGTLHAGVKYSWVRADNDYRFSTVAPAGEQLDPSQSSRFLYQEELLAAYFQYNRPLGRRATLEVGLRGEYTRSDGDLRRTDGSPREHNRRRYFDLFPSLALSWKAGGQSTFALSYGSRIDRPAYQDLNPFEYMLDELTCWQGNPFLEPQRSHRVALSWSWRKTAVTASYTCLTDYRTQISDTLDVKRLVMTPRNLGRQHRLALELFQQVRVARWWDAVAGATCYWLNNDIAYDRMRRFDLKRLAAIFSLRNTFRLPGRLRLELGGSFTTRRLGEAIEVCEPTGSVDVALSRKFLGDRLEASLGVSDLFWTSNWDSTSRYEGFYLYNWGKWESRQVKFNLTYRFGAPAGRERRSDRDLDELNRL